MAYIWDIYILDWGTEKAWDEYNGVTQGVGVRRIGERGEGAGGGKVCFFDTNETQV